MPKSALISKIQTPFGGIQMKSKLKLYTASIAVVAAFVAISLMYKVIAVDRMNLPAGSAQSAVPFVLGIMFAAVIIIRFIVPHFEKGCDNREVPTDVCVGVRCFDWAAWLLVALCLSALIASPLAGVTYYFFYAACFGVLSVLCALFPCIKASEKVAVECEKLPSVAVFTVVSLLLCLVPTIGVYGGICGAAFWTAALREEKSVPGQSRVCLCVSVLSTLLATAATVVFVLLFR